MAARAASTVAAARRVIQAASTAGASASSSSSSSATTAAAAAGAASSSSSVLLTRRRPLPLRAALSPSASHLTHFHSASALHSLSSRSRSAVARRAGAAPPAAFTLSRHFSSARPVLQEQQQKPEDSKQEDSKKAKDEQKKKDGGGGGGGGGGGDGIIRSPFQAFVDTLRTELQKSREMQEGMTALQGEVGKAQDSETMRAAREYYERAMLRVSLQENPRLRAAAERLRKDGGKVSDAVAATLRQMEESELIKGLSNTSSWLARQLADSTAPIRQTEAYRTFSETILEALDDGASSIRIYASKDEDAKTLRARKRAVRLQKIGRAPPAVPDVEDDKYWVERDRIKALRQAEQLAEEIRAAAEAAAETGEETPTSAEGQDASGAATASESPSPSPAPAPATPEEPLEKAPPPPPPSGFALSDPLVARVNPKAGSALVAVEGSASDDAPSTWSRIKAALPFQDQIESMKEKYGESENPVIERVRSWNDSIRSWLLDENETAAAIRLLRRVEPSFTMDAFQRQLREYIAPELVDAMHSANRVILKQWCSERTYSVVFAQIEPILKEPGAKMHGNLLDLRSVDVVQGKLLDATEAIETGGKMPVLVVRWETTELLYFTSSNPKRIAEHQAAEAAKRKARLAKSSAAKKPAAAGGDGEAEKVAASTKSKESAQTPAAAPEDAPKEVIISGSKDRAESCVYVAVLMRDEKDTDNVVTGGWKVIELIRRSEGAFL
ncbi:protein translocase subunit [Tilletia horrida]|uniref:Protein translocase subunit n=1 Tax=Tilletia horrida TaxID=155126 RepID=A0AAN6GFU7_9BASI|nr:protein translocase subunit [Tilletia horrida]